MGRTPANVDARCEPRRYNHTPSEDGRTMTHRGTAVPTTTILRLDSEFHSLRREWNDLLARSSSDVPFLRHEYLATWWSSLGGGEWPRGELCLVASRDENGRLVGLAPLFRTESGPQAVLRWVGSGEVSDYLDLIVTPEALPVFVETALDVLQAEAWRSLELDNVLEGSATLPALEAAARRRGWSSTRERPKPSPLIRLERGWEGYLEGLGKKQRHELRRKTRRAEAYPERLEIRHVREAAGLESDVGRFLSLMAHDAAKAAFLTDAMREHFHRLARAAAEARWLDLVFLEFGGRAAAAYFNFDYRNRIWVYNSGLDPEFLTLSPGWVLMGAVIELAAREGKEAVDLLRGEEPYKVHLGGVPRYVEGLRVTRP